MNLINVFDFVVYSKMTTLSKVSTRARQRAGRPGPEIFDPGFQNPGFSDPEKKLILNPESGPDFKFSPELENATRKCPELENAEI